MQMIDNAPFPVLQSAWEVIRCHVADQFSTKAQVIMPRAIWGEMQLEPGDRFEMEIDGKRIILKQNNSSRLMSTPQSFE